MYFTDFCFLKNLLGAAYKNAWDGVSRKTQHDCYQLIKTLYVIFEWKKKTLAVGPVNKNILQVNYRNITKQGAKIPSKFYVVTLFLLFNLDF